MPYARAAAVRQLSNDGGAGYRVGFRASSWKDRAELDAWGGVAVRSRVVRGV